MTGHLVIKGHPIGGGRPVLCVPVAEKERAGILGSAARAIRAGAEMIEWRMDFFGGIREWGQAGMVLGGLSEACRDTALLCTFRSRRQGGEAEIPAGSYEELLLKAAASGHADMLDVEVSEIPDPGALIAAIHAYPVCVVASRHYFSHTPETGKMEEELLAMKGLGADIAKLAVMPEKNTDVLRLLEATARVKEKDPAYPLITMAMGGMGMISRLCGQVFGSDVTFASVGRASAPGQVPLEDAAYILGLISEGMEAGS